MIEDGQINLVYICLWKTVFGVASFELASTNIYNCCHYS